MKRSSTAKYGVSALLMLMLAACGGGSPTTSPPTAVEPGDLQEYTEKTLEAQTVNTRAQFFNGLSSPLNLTYPAAMSLPVGGMGEAVMGAGQSISGNYGGGSYSARVPLSLTGNAYALTYGSGQTLWLPRLNPAPFGTALEQLANLTDKSVDVSYTRATVNGGKPLNLGSINTYSAGAVLIDLKPADLTFFFHDRKTKALLAQGTFSMRPGDSVAVVLYGNGSDTKVAMVPGKAVTPPNPPTNGAPQASFSVSPASVSPLTPVVLDASATIDPDKDPLTYRWELGDGTVATGVKVSTAYAKPGTYTVKLTATDSKGASNTTTRTVTVTAPAATATAPLSAFVTDKDGTALAGATVTAGSATATTDARGVATLSVPAGSPAVVAVTKAGYVPQTLRTEVGAGSKGATIKATMLATAAPVSLNEDAGGTVTGSVGTLVTFPADAFVDASGKPVTGSIEVRVTPVNVTTSDINAFPGEGQAVNTSGQLGTLISYGMMDVQATQNGQPLQLAPGKSAALQMDVTTTGATLGADIPLWWFNTATGLWVEEGAGKIVTKTGGGLALVGSVNHFTTWNFDYFMGADAASFQVKVKLADGSDLKPGEQAYVRITFGQPGEPVNVRTSYVGADGATIINAPANTPMTVAAWYGGMTGTLSSNTTTSPNVVTLDKPYVSNVSLTPATQTVKFGRDGVLVQVNGGYTSYFILTNLDGTPVDFTASRELLCVDAIPCMETTGVPEQFRLYLPNKTASYKLAAKVYEDNGNGIVTTQPVTINIVADPAYVAAPVIKPNALTSSNGPDGIRFRLQGSYGYIPTFTLNLGGKITTLGDCNINRVFPCFTGRGSWYTLYVPNPSAEMTGTLTVQAGGVINSVPVTVKPYPGVINPGDLNFQLRADHVGYLPVNASGAWVEIQGQGVRATSWSYSPTSWILAAEENKNTVVPYRAYDGTQSSVVGSITVTATPGRFMPSHNIFCGNVTPFDMSAGAEIPFTNRVWSVIAAPDVQTRPSINQQGVVQFTNEDIYNIYIVRVTNAADPNDYIEGLLSFSCRD